MTSDDTLPEPENSTTLRPVISCPASLGLPLHLVEESQPEVCHTEWPEGGVKITSNNPPGTDEVQNGLSSFVGIHQLYFPLKISTFVLYYVGNTMQPASLVILMLQCISDL